MTLIVSLLAAAALAQAQTAPAPARPAPQRSAGDITRDLNAAPPARAQPQTQSQTQPQSQPQTGGPPQPGAQPQARQVQAPVQAPPATPPAPRPAPPATVAVDPSALPFRLDLPAGFRVTQQGRPGSDFNIYAVRRGETPFVMIYVGPTSQFPIYDGERVSRGGRDTLVVTEDGQRLALEHLFRSPTPPAEIHVWVASPGGADRDLAERIAQTVDPR